MHLELSSFGFLCREARLVPSTPAQRTVRTTLRFALALTPRKGCYSTFSTPFMTIQWPGKVHKYGKSPFSAGAVMWMVNSPFGFVMSV